MTHLPARVPAVVAVVLTVLAAVAVPTSVVASHAAPTVVVNTVADDPDLVAGDGVCDTGVVLADGTTPACTLRAALQEANASSVDTIAFAVGAADGLVAGVATISPATALPDVTAPLVLDGTTQPGFVGTPVVVVDGSLTAGAVGLTVRVGPSEVAGLAVHSFDADGIALQGTTDTLVRDSHLGVAPDGLTAPGNGAAGVLVDGGAGNVVQGNVIGGNAAQGVVVDQGPDVRVVGNRIGVGVDDVTPLPNGDAGIEVAIPTSADVRIGGTDPADGNRIAFNAGPGVTMRTGGLDDVSVLGNALHDNGGLGIDLNDNGLTPNDAGDGDGGANGSLNFPVPTAATPDEVAFDLDVPAGSYRIEVFRNPGGADPSGHGEGEQLVGVGTVTHPGGGPAGFTLAGLTGVADGDVLTLTATEDLGASGHGSTSEFSLAVTADDHLAVVNSSGDDVDAVPGDGVCATTTTNVEGDPACTLRAALEEAAASALVDEVRFAVPAADPGVVGGVLTITPGTALPGVTDGVLVDGTTQPGWVDAPVVVLDGSGAAGDLLHVSAGATTLRGLALVAAGRDALHVDGAVEVLLERSRVVDSTRDGVRVVGATADDVAVVDTTISGSGGLAIDLGGDGVTANDPGDVDTGPNGLHNRPVVTGAAAAGGTVTLEVALDQPAGDVLLQVFTTADPDPSGAGEGDVLVHRATVTHPGGVATHTLVHAGDLTTSTTLTATEDLGTGYGATSEFSDVVTRPVATDDPGDVPSLLGGAVSWWRLGEAAGTTAADLGSAGADGTTAGGVAPGAEGALAGDRDTAYAFDGVDDVVVAPHVAAHLLDQGTVSLWVRLDALGVARVPFSKDATGLGDGGHAELRIEPDGAVVHRLGTTTTTVEVASAPGAVTTGRWHHLAATFGPRGAEVWVDGVRVARDATTTSGWGPSSGGAGNTEPITIGASGAASATGAAAPLVDHLAGRIDEVAVLDAQLDGPAIAALAGAARQHHVVEGGGVLAVAAAGGVLANDHDPDGDALQATLVTGPSAAASFALQPDGSFSYTPAAGFVGTDSFTYVADDGVATSDPATATVTVLPGRGSRVVVDSTGNGHHGMPAGGMTSGDAVAGRVGGALDLDGVDDRIEVTNLDVAGTALTLSAWVDPDTIGADPTVLAKAVGLGSADVEWRLLLADTSVTTARAAAEVRTTAGLAGAVDPGSLDVADGWVHLAARYDGAEVVLFVDGTAVASAPHGGALRPDPTVSTWIGGAPGGAAFDGRVDEVTVSGVARSDGWVAATHATQADPAAALTVGATQTEASPGWTTSSTQARSGSSSALAPSGVFRSWLTLDGLAEPGLEAVAWWRVNTLTGLDLGQGVRAGDAAAVGPVRQDEVGLAGPSGFDLGQVDGARTQLVAPPAGQAPAVDAWQRVVLRIDPSGALSATAAGADVPTSGTTPAGVTPTGSVGLRVGALDPTVRWWVDDLRLRRYVAPEPVASLGRTELAP